MALIRCPECKKMVSTTLDACPHCGFRLSKQDKEETLEEAIDNLIEDNDEKNIEDEGSFGGGFVLGFILSAVGLIVAICAGGKATRNGAVLGFFIQIFVVGAFLIVFFSLRFAGVISQ